MRTAIVCALMTVGALLPATVSAAQAPPQDQNATATLTQKNGSGVDGTATLRWNPATRVMTVTVDAHGLVPQSSHPNHIHDGTCASPTMKIAYGLDTLTADSHGVAHAITTLTNVDAAMFHGGWFVCVHRGPTLSGDGMRSIACGDVG